MAGPKLREWLGRNRGGLAVGVIGMVVVGLVATFLQRPAATPLVVQSPGPGIAVAQAPRPSPSPPPIVPIAIHVSGEVNRPGLYQLPPGARVDDAVQVAGGATSDAELQRLNLAARLADGQQVNVPRKADPRASAGAVTSLGPTRVNVNLATVAELDGLPGVGPVSAQRIVAYREQHGPFTAIEQLREAKLVSGAMFEKIRELITV